MLAFFRVMNYLKTASSTHLRINYSWVHQEFAFDQLWFILSAGSILKDTLLSTYDETVLCVQKQWIVSIVKNIFDKVLRKHVESDENLSKYRSVCNIYIYKVNKKKYWSDKCETEQPEIILSKSGVIINHNKLVLVALKFSQWK